MVLQLAQLLQLLHLPRLLQLLHRCSLQVLGFAQYYGLRSGAGCRSLAVRNPAADLTAAAAAAAVAAASAATLQPAEPWP